MVLGGSGQELEAGSVWSGLVSGPLWFGSFVAADINVTGPKVRCPRAVAFVEGRHTHRLVVCG